jgi:hypothetical protein
MAATGTNPTTNHPRWGYFAGWVAVGGAWSLAFVGIASIGLFILPLALAATVLLAPRTPSGGSAFGLVSGLGLAPLYVAYLNRPGSVQAWSPWPWAATGATFLTAGVVMFLVVHLRQRERPRRVKSD